MLPLPTIKTKFAKGFTLIELLVATGILAILMAIAFAGFRIFSKQVDVDSTAQQIISTLQLAQNRTLASENETSYGVHFETSKYVFFKGTTYNSADSSNKVYNLSRVEIYQINLAGGATDVVFDRVKGTTADSGNVVIRSTLDTAKIATITVNFLGEASLQGSSAPAGTRITDTRHLHFNLGWSIQSSSTLTLVFSDPPNPDVTQNISMAPYFNSGKTVFDWSGSIDVNGSSQTPRIHTHSLDATNTLLSVHRDRQKNTKAVQISIDGKGIVSYTAAGAATVGSFGGTMSVQ